MSRPARLALGLGGSFALLVVVVLLSLSIGNKDLSLVTVWSSLLDPGSSSGAFADTVVASRIPRTALGVLVGASLAVAGAVMQGVTRNPLGDPGLFGVNAGAAAAVVTGIAFLGLGASSASVWVALPGAVLAVVVVYLVGSGRRGTMPVRLVLAGAVVTAVVFAYVQAVALSLPTVFDSYRYWVIGSLAGRDPQLVLDILPFVVVGLAIALSIGGSLNALALGDDTARALGAHLGRTRILGAVSATLLCAAATAAVGPIAFVGLAVPHIVRSFTGDDHRWLIPYSLLLGPVLLLCADVLGRVLVRPGELMVGVVTAFVGGPVLLLAVRRMGGGAGSAGSARNARNADGRSRA
ncbi:FecCD family ABC transporter permease [Compostimonas suwonensis]|uniref:Iron complex transport system permease protein n=1 Tax=Compostimonas suwonensis TaxID=1048394 RepID=A0A2M9BUL1_9MICO|nr:iron chelate uptake ABC transporter family permease subunit [Compostimonas suwonensis]PJJ61623.1 iron complex transport system permease protein [Compostimonas suwonensis]